MSHTFAYSYNSIDEYQNCECTLKNVNKYKYVENFVTKL